MEALLDPEIVEGLRAFGFDTQSSDTAGPEGSELLELLRSQLEAAEYDPQPAAGVTREDVTVPGFAGAPDVAVRIFRPAERPSSAAPGLLWMHGGGYVIGSTDLDVDDLDRLVLATGCVTVSVNYRLAPETPYPGPLDDCCAALVFLSSQGDELGVDASRLSVAGRSAGAGLAAAVALYARDNAIPLAHQHLLYPMIDDRPSTPSSTWEDPVWSPPMNILGWSSYLGELYGEEVIPEGAAVARARDLSGLPPTYIHVGARDRFVLEDIEFASRLVAQHVPVELHVLPGACHGFDVVAPQATVSRQATSLSEAALRRAFNP
jgi:acetyl esterase/lipase